MDDTFTEGGQAPSPNDYESLLDSKVGNYILEKLIGVGGYGTVFKAYHALLGTVVAIKVSHPLVGSIDNIKSILRQGYKALPSLTHPNICRILDFGQFTHQNRERFYVALEYIEGKHLGYLPIPLTKADVDQYVSWWAQVCEGVAYVHQYRYFNYLGFEVTGIYHGDIKPDNVILDSKTGQPKIVDFLYLGFKLKVDTGTMRPDQELRDITGAMGTAGYMAPEQEQQGQISVRTEVYALGVTLFRLLTTNSIQRNQTNPFRAGHTPEEIRALLDNPSVSPGLCALISKATQVNPTDRYERVQAMIDALNYIRSDSSEIAPAPVEPPPISSPNYAPSASQWNYRNKIASRRANAGSRQKRPESPHTPPLRESFMERVAHTVRQRPFLIVGLIMAVVGLVGWSVFKLVQPNTDFSSSTDTSRSITGARTDRVSAGPNLTVGTTGTYYALLIGVNDYQDNRLKDLNRPIADMESLQSVLMELYDFRASHIVALKNPTRALILDEFDKLTTNIGPADNLLIFYAGHGVYDEQLKQGYWLPADARKVNRADWLANSTVREYINGINARHVLLISDACYSGSFLVLDRGESAMPSIEQAYQRSSRRAITSSTMEIVPDESIFAEELVVSLRRNTDHFLTTSDLYQRFAPTVTNKNASQLPQFGRIKGDVDQGGDFIFVKRQDP